MDSQFRCWCRTNLHGLFWTLTRAWNQQLRQKAIVEIMCNRVEIVWNLASWSETAFWTIVVTLHKEPLENGEFFCLILENCDFAIYSNFCFINNLLLKIQNNVPLVLRRPLKSVVYDFAFNSILPFLVNFSILPSKLVISVN